MRCVVKIFFQSLVLVFLVCGCATSTINIHPAAAGQVSASGRNVDRNIEASINGVYLFYAIPLWSGAYTRPNEKSYRIFRDFVAPKYMRNMLERYRKRHDLTAIENLQISESSSGWWTLGIIWQKSVKAKAVGIKEVKKQPLK